MTPAPAGRRQANFRRSQTLIFNRKKVPRPGSLEQVQSPSGRGGSIKIILRRRGAVKANSRQSRQQRNELASAVSRNAVWLGLWWRDSTSGRGRRVGRRVKSRVPRLVLREAQRVFILNQHPLVGAVGRHREQDAFMGVSVIHRYHGAFRRPRRMQLPYGIILQFHQRPKT